jgi:chromosome segregation ATPase
MNYDSWRITFQSANQAARSAFNSIHILTRQMDEQDEEIKRLKENEKTAWQNVHILERARQAQDKQLVIDKARIEELTKALEKVRANFSGAYYIVKPVLEKTDEPSSL